MSLNQKVQYCGVESALVIHAQSSIFPKLVKKELATYRNRNPFGALVLTSTYGTCERSRARALSLRGRQRGRCRDRVRALSI